MANRPSVSHTNPRNTMEALAQYFTPAVSFNMLRNIEEITKILLGWAGGTLVIFLRRDFGERYLSPGGLIMGYVFIRICLGFANLRSILAELPMIEPPASEHTVNRWYITSFVLLSLVHLIRIFLRNRAGVPWHSQSPGVSWFWFLIPLSGYRISDWVLYRFIEPGVCLAIAWFILPIILPDGTFTRNWLIFASLGLFFHNNMVYNGMRNRYLDLVDGEIASRYFNEAREANRVNRHTIYETAGYSVVPVPRMAQEILPPDIAATVQETLSREETQQPTDTPSVQ